MAEMGFTLGLWNVAWAKPGSPQGVEIRERLQAANADVICLTESYLDMLPGAHVVTSEADYGYPLIGGRRKVLLWSKQPWTHVNTAQDSPLPPGRFVVARTQTPLGDCCFVGVCIPWRAAHVSTGHRNRKPWEDHLAYLKVFQTLRKTFGAKRVVVLGDFNQRIPRHRQPEHVHLALHAALGDELCLATAGPIGEPASLAIDHVAHSRDVRASHLKLLPSVGKSGLVLSDHFGLTIQLNGRSVSAEQGPICSNDAKNLMTSRIVAVDGGCTF